MASEPTAEEKIKTLFALIRPHVSCYQTGYVFAQLDAAISDITEAAERAAHRAGWEAARAECEARVDGVTTAYYNQRPGKGDCERNWYGGGASAGRDILDAIAAMP